MDTFAFTDLLQPGNSIRVFARISVQRAEDGGRRGPFKNGFRPNHNFGSPDNREFYIGQVEVPENIWVHPGETHGLYVKFLNGPGLSELMQIGRKWRLQEGPKLIATAEILAIDTHPAV